MGVVLYAPAIALNQGNVYIIQILKILSFLCLYDKSDKIVFLFETLIVYRENAFYFVRIMIMLDEVLQCLFVLNTRNPSILQIYIHI